MQQVTSFSFSGEIDLVALFSGEAAVAADASMRISGTIVLPDRLRFTVALGPAEERIAIHGVTVGHDTYVQDPESGQWFQGTPPDSDVLAALQLVGLLLVPNDPGASLSGPVDLDDGSRAYVLVSDEPGQESGTELPLGSGGRVTRTVGVTDFLTTGVRVTAQGLDGETRDFLTISYQGYDEPFAIEPPAEYLPLPDAVLESETLVPGRPESAPPPATDVGLSRDVPVPLGQALLLADGWEVTVLSVTPDATESVLAENRFNEPPGEGQQFFIARMRATYRGDGSDNFYGSFRSRAVGDGGVSYSTFRNSCGVIPDDLPDPEVFTGGTIEGNGCWAIDSGDAASLVMFDDPPGFDDSDRRWFALQ